MARTHWPVSGRTVLITGAARGIGAGTARALAARGARVALLGLEPELLESLATELGAERAAAFPCDVTDRDGLRSAVDAAAERFGGIDVAIANAGVATLSPLDSISDEDFQRTVDVNLLGVWWTLRAALPHVAARQGYLLPIASLAASLTAPLMGAYPATKAAVEALGNTLRLELRPQGVAVGVAYFGFIDTDMVRKSMGTEASAAMTAGQPGFITRPVPVEHAIDAIVRGVERRARRVYAPRWILPALLAGGAFQQLVDRGVRSGPLTRGIELSRANPTGPTTAADPELTGGQRNGDGG